MWFWHDISCLSLLHLHYKVASLIHDMYLDSRFHQELIFGMKHSLVKSGGSNMKSSSFAIFVMMYLTNNGCCGYWGTTTVYDLRTEGIYGEPTRPDISTLDTTTPTKLPTTTTTITTTSTTTTTTTTSTTTTSTTTTTTTTTTSTT